MQVLIWGREENTRKLHLVTWDTSCKTNKEGGIGLHQARLVNQTFMMKTCWNLCVNSNSLWVSVIRNKYKCGDAKLPTTNTKRSGSNLWSICSNWHTFRANLLWSLGKGNYIDFWQDA